MNYSSSYGNNYNNIKNARYRKIPCWYNINTCELIGKNWFYDILVDINIWIDFKVLGLQELPIWIEED